MEQSILEFFESLRSPFGNILAGAFSLFGETLVLVALISLCLLYTSPSPRD